MFLPDEKMDINKFQLVHIPSKAEFASRYGMTAVPLNRYTEEQFAMYEKNKIDSIADMEAYDAMMRREESQKASSDES